MVIDDISTHSNAYEPIFLISLGIFVFLQPKIKVLVFVSIIALQLFLESYVVLLESTFIFSNSEQFKKTDSAISLTELGIVIDDISTRSNAYEPIFLISLGIFVFLQPKIKVLVFVSIIALQLFLESYVVLLESTFISFNSKQLKKGLSSIFLIELGMVIDDISVARNAFSPIIVTFLPLYSDGIVTSVSFPRYFCIFKVPFEFSTNSKFCFWLGLRFWEERTFSIFSSFIFFSFN